MYKVLFVLLAIAGMVAETYAQQKQDMNNQQSDERGGYSRMGRKTAIA